jgi:hypothetical protein
MDTTASHTRGRSIVFSIACKCHRDERGIRLFGQSVINLIFFNPCYLFFKSLFSIFKENATDLAPNVGFLQQFCSLRS